MRISKDTVVSFHYTLTADSGQTIDSSDGKDPLTYLHGAGNIIPGLEGALSGKQSGDKLNVSIPPEQGYGERDDSLVQDVPKSAFGGVAEVQAGMQFQASTPQGDRIVTVTRVEGDAVTVDGNHPLAGETLNFDVEVTEVRAATEEEIRHGHVHGPGGHHHD